MAGIPQLREAGWLYPAGSDIPIALVRLEEQMDGSGWDLLLNDPATAATQQARYDDEVSARTELDRIYADGRADGKWRIHRSDNPHDGPTDADR